MNCPQAADGPRGGCSVTVTELVSAMSRESGRSRSQTDRIVRELLGAVVRALTEGQDVELRRFGAFRIRERRAARGRHPRTGEELQIPARIAPVFRPAQSLKDRVAETPPEDIG
ncbi:MAG: hypothetical protein GF355_04205 [Candidatus Eisenbacteria bacterium]|nr:hypothetical protein [Candidatus Eisenbacteria bacterium]